MAGPTFDLAHNAPDVAKALAAQPGQLLPVLDQALGRGAQEVARAEKQEAPKYRSELANSIQAGRVELLTHQVQALKKYGSYVDEGTKGKGWVPISVMADWIRAKGITARDPTMTQQQLAKLFRLRIGQRGSRGQNFWEPTFERTVPRVVAIARDAVSAFLAKGRTA